MFVSLNKKKIVLFVVFVFLIFLFYYLDFSKHFSIENIKKNKEILQLAVQENYFWSVAKFIGIYILLTSFALPFAVFLTIIGGFLFGAFYGAIYSSFAASVGASVAFLIFRYLVGDWIKYKFENRLVNFRQEVKKHGYSYLLSIHLSAVVPLFMVNIFASLAEVKIWTFFWTTLVGTFPAFLVYAFAGKQFHTINSIHDVFTIKVLLALLAMSVLVSMPMIIRMYKKSRI